MEKKKVHEFPKEVFIRLDDDTDDGVFPFTGRDTPPCKPSQQ